MPAAWLKTRQRIFAALAATGLAAFFLAAHLPADAKARHHHKAIHKAAHKVAHKAAPKKPAPGAVPSAAPQQVIPSRAELLASDPAILERIGRHLVAGYELHSTVKALVEKKAIAGIFISDHNVRRRSVAEIKADIDQLQDIRKAQGLPPLIVAADQEGGSVSRLSPPLKYQQGLGRKLAAAASDLEREAIVRGYASLQASELRRIGVNMNFAPVVDLNLKSTRRNDGETRLSERAFSPDPDVVAKIAGWYCDELATAGLMCTLKHFPGLGRVGNDTHKSMGEIKAAESQLRVRDWVPYTRLMSRPNVATMLAHVRLREVDKDTPASYSDRVIGGILRDGWKHDGILITDDFSMGAVVRSKTGIGPAAVKALNAGADFILVSFSDKDLNAVLVRLIAADADGQLDHKMMEKSVVRSDRILDQTRQFATR